MILTLGWLEQLNGMIETELGGKELNQEIIKNIMNCNMANVNSAL